MNYRKLLFFKWSIAILLLLIALISGCVSSAPENVSSSANVSQTPTEIIPSSTTEEPTEIETPTPEITSAIAVNKRARIADILSTEANLSLQERKIHDMINVERNKLNIHSLQYDKSLAKLARKVSLAKTDLYIGSDNERYMLMSPRLRAEIEGCTCDLQAEGGGFIVVEAKSAYGLDDFYSVDELASYYVYSMKTNYDYTRFQPMMSNTLFREGVGVAVYTDKYTNKTTIYITQDFC